MKKLITLLLISIYIPTAFAAFDDVPSVHSNYDAITYVYDEGIVEGYPDHTFKPDKTINRAEFTKIIVESQFTSAVINSCTESSFPDVPENEWYAKYVCTAKSADIIGGYPDGTFKPGNTINFVEAAKVTISSFDLPIESGDVWYEGYVKTLEKYDAFPTTISSFSQEITRGEMAEMIMRLRSMLAGKATQTYENLAYAEGTGPAPDYSNYENWAIPTENFEWWIMQQDTDCVWMDSGWTAGGDLLSTLIAVREARDLASLDVYTPEYLKILENLIVYHTHEKWNKDFYAFYVCHAFNNIDIVAGFLYPKGESAFDEETGYMDFGKLSTNDTALAVRHGDRLYIFNYIRVIGGTATGAEPPICTGEATLKGILWSCFLGLHIDENDYIDGSYMEFTTLEFDTGEVNTWEEIVYDTI